MFSLFTVTPRFPEVYEGGRPKLGGLMDPRQGAIDRQSRYHMFGIVTVGLGGNIKIVQVKLIITVQYRQQVELGCNLF